MCVHTPSRAQYRRKKRVECEKVRRFVERKEKEKERERVIARQTERERERERKRFPFSPVSREPDRQDSIPSTSAATSASWTINVRSHRKKSSIFSLVDVLFSLLLVSCLYTDYRHRLPSASTEIPSFRNFLRNHATDPSVAMENPVCNATRVSLRFLTFSPTGIERKRELSTLFPSERLFNQRKFPVSRKIVSYP